jgi:hypothetical protein
MAFQKPLKLVLGGAKLEPWYIYIYIERERERESVRYWCMYQRTDRIGMTLGNTNLILIYACKGLGKDLRK